MPTFFRPCLVGLGVFRSISQAGLAQSERLPFEHLSVSSGLLGLNNTQP